jgi:hypothetical protein
MYDEYYGGMGKLLNDEKYIAPIYDYMLFKGMKIFISNIDENKVHVLGTPEELQEFLQMRS